MTPVPEPTRRTEPVGLEPYPDVLLEGIPDRAPGPEARYEAREAIALAFIAGLQHLPPRQRAVLVLRDVLGFRAAEVADLLDTTEASVHGLLRRARAAVGARLPAAGRERAPVPNSRRERDRGARFADAVEAGDVDGIVALLTDDARMTMPPLPHEYQGAAAIGAFLRDREVRRGAPLRLVPTRDNTQPAFACYLPAPETDTLLFEIVWLPVCFACCYLDTFISARGAGTTLPGPTAGAICRPGTDRPARAARPASDAHTAVAAAKPMNACGVA
jgi:RNA polymerase sigma-70 factor (ECF subfamily)